MSAGIMSGGIMSGDNVLDSQNQHLVIGLHPTVVGRRQHRTLHKHKGDKAICRNSRGISLMSVVGKVLAGVMLRRLLTHVVDIVMPESHCGFRHGRGTIDMMFVG